MVEHLDDLQADFLAIWGINLDVEQPPPAWRFFPMCRRTFAYDGVMAARLAEFDRRQKQPAPAPPRVAHRPPAAPAGATQQVKEVSEEQLRRMHPDLF